MTGRIFDIKEFSIHDGPGGRVTVFMKGCPLRCVWCHNPEGQSCKAELMYSRIKCSGCGCCLRGSNDEIRRYGRDPDTCPNGALTIVGTDISAKDLAKRLTGYREAFEALAGGVTFSGGEPMHQPEFLEIMLDSLRGTGIHCAIETCGYASTEIFDRIIHRCDIVIMDIKLYNSELHKKYTGVDNALILNNARLLMKSHIPHVFRTPLIPGITDGYDNLNEIEHFVQGSKWEKLPYNSLAGAKYASLGRKYSLDGLTI